MYQKLIASEKISSYLFITRMGELKAPITQERWLGSDPKFHFLSN